MTVGSTARATRLTQRSAALAARFDEILRTRMAGLPMLNPALRVEAVGFELLPPDAGDAASPTALGILLTPWFMNLVLLPVQPVDGTSAVGRARMLRLQGRALAFIGAHEPAVGAFAACSLFSPVFEFARQADALAMAQAVLAELRPAPRPARRAFLLGRAGAAV